MLISKNKKAQGATEYVIILVLVAICSITVIGLFGDSIRGLFVAATGIIQDEVNKILRHYDELPARQKQLINLFYHQNKSVTEIATALNISQPAVSIQLSRALKKLKGQQAKIKTYNKYIVALSLMACVSFTAIAFFGDNIRGLFVDSSTHLQGDTTTKSNDGKETETEKAKSKKGLDDY